MTGPDKDTIRSLITDREAPGGPQWADGVLYVVDIDDGDHLDVSEPMPLSSARARLAELIAGEHPDTPRREQVLAELRAGPAGLYARGKVYALNPHERLWGGVRPVTEEQ